MAHLPQADGWHREPRPRGRQRRRDDPLPSDIDFDKVAENAGESAASVRQLEQLTGRKTLPSDIWIDSDGRVRRQAIDYSASQPVEMHIQLTVDYERFGVPVDMHAPDASDTTDLTDLVGR